MRKRFFEIPFLSLLPFLLLYLLIAITQDPGNLIGDESRYIGFASNLLNGFYSPPPPDINLWNGPGFPLYLIPFVYFNSPLLLIRISNAFLSYATLLIFNKSLLPFLDRKRSFFFTLAFACYYMPFKSIPFILSETLTLFLISTIVLLSTRYFTEGNQFKSPKQLIFLVLALASLAMTKVVFGLVYLVAAAALLLIFLITKNRLYVKAVRLLFFSLLLCIPYLNYTYSITGRFFYWSNAGGMSAYWMSNPVPGEYGEWHNDSLSSPPLDQASFQQLHANHEKDYSAIYKFRGVERDDAFKDAAFRNIREYPVAYFKNWLANWSRMFFNFPVSYVPFHKGTILNMLANIPVLILILYSSVLTLQKRNTLPFAFTFLLVVFGLYLLASSFFSAYDRMFYVLAPVFGTWIAYSLVYFRKSTDQFQKSK